MEKQNRKESKLSNLPVAAVDFIKLVINKMRYRKQVRQDVQAELAAHFEDELKGCKADTEREQKARQLVNGFGDVKMLAILLRRAKKRCRPLWRTVLARSFQTVGVLFICLVLYIVWFLTGKPVITKDYIAEFNNMVRPVADESLNAAPLYNKAIEVFEELPDEISTVLGKKYYEVTEEDKQLIGKWLADNEQVLQQVIAGTQKPYYWQHYEGEEMLSVLLPHLSGYRNLAKTLCWRSRQLAEKGRYGEAFSDIKTCYRFGRHVKGNVVVLIEQLVGIAIEALAVENLRGILSEHKIDSEALTMLQRDLEQVIAGEDFAVSFAGEKLFIYDEIQRCFTEDRFGGGHLYLTRMGQISSVDDPYAHTIGELIVGTIFEPEAWPIAVKVLFFHPNKQQTREATDRFYAYCETIAQKTPAQIRNQRIDVEKETMKIIRDNVFLNILAPALQRASELGQRHRSNVEATVTILALQRYKADKDSYPEDLQQLITSGYLRQLPLDVFSDKPLVYRKTGDDFILYSFGENLEDDGGKVSRNKSGKPRLWGYDESGADAIFWPMSIYQAKGDNASTKNEQGRSQGSKIAN
jgi:dsDNA-binding SOS-regulon protein